MICAVMAFAERFRRPRDRHESVVVKRQGTNVNEDPTITHRYRTTSFAWEIRHAFAGSGFNI